MIRGILLILDPGYNWDKIAKAQRGYWFITVLHLLPLLAITLAAECYCLFRFGERYDEIDQLVRPERLQIIRYGAAEAIFGILIVFLGALLIRKVVNSSTNSTYTYKQCFTLTAYGVSPYYLLRLLDGVPYLPASICFALGVVMMVWVLYQGVPLMLRTESPITFGMYLSVITLLTVMLALAHMLAVMILRGDLDLDAWRKYADELKNFKF